MLRVRFLRRVAASVALVAAPACNGGDLVLPADGTPSAIAIVEGNGQTGSVGAPLSDSLVVRVTDGQERAVAGLSVVFDLASPEAGGDVVPDTALTGENGQAWTRWVLGGSAGAQAVEARVVGEPLTVRFTASARPAGAHTIEAVGGDEQTAPVGTALPDSLVARVTDRFGNPVAGAAVEWTVESGSVSPATSATGDDGRAATRRVLGSSAGSQTTSASSPDLNGSAVTFTHIATPGTAASLVLISGSDQSAPAGTELPERLVVRLVDEAGNGIPDRAVSWVVPTGNGTASPESSNTDSDGFASTRWTLNGEPGPNRLTAVVSGVGVVEFVATGTGGGGDPAPSATRSTVTASPGTIPAVTGASTITVTVRDGQGRPVPDATVTLTASGGGNDLTQPGGTTGADGVATGTLRSSVPGTKVVTATVNGSVTIQQTATVTVTLVPVADHLVFRVQPSDVDERQRIEPAVEVAVVDQNGNLVAESGIRIRIELVPDNGRLRGDRNRDTENGVAVFDDLEVQRGGEGYRLRASAPDLPGLGTAESEPFDVIGVTGD
ncbi:MAG: Ig-like domain-containing protein [Nocardioidaceae bacterium]